MCQTSPHKHCREKMRSSGDKEAHYPRRKNSVTNAGFNHNRPRHGAGRQERGGENKNEQPAKPRKLSCEVPSGYTGHLAVRNMNCSPTKRPTEMMSPPKSPAVPAVYSGSKKFNDPPSPKVLPKPPMHWVEGSSVNDENSFSGSCAQMTSLIKVMLNVPVQS